MKPSWLADLPRDWEHKYRHDKQLIAQIKERLKRDATLSVPSRYAKYINEIDAYAKEVLGVTWWSKQLQIALSFQQHKYTIVAASFGVGKTFIVGSLINWWFDVFDPGIALTTAPTWSQVEKLLWGEIASQRPNPARGRLYKTEIKDHPKHFALGLSTNREERFQGFHEERICVALDEGPGIRQPVWNAAVDNIPVGPDNRVIAIGNPIERSGPFYDASNDPVWNCIHIGALQHPNIIAELEGKDPPYPKAVRLEWVQERIRKWCVRIFDPEPEEKVDLFEFPVKSDSWWKPNPLAESKLLGWFPSESEEQIIPMAAVDAAQRRVEKPGHPVRLGVDVARGGGDESVIAIFQGNHSEILWTYEGADTMTVSGNAVRFIKQYLPSEVRVDVIGVGAGVYDRLEELRRLGDLPEGTKIISVGVGESPVGSEDFTEEFVMLRDQLWWMIRLGISEMDLPDDALLSSQLIAPRWGPNQRGKVKVESKDDMKKRGVKSPDRAEAIMLAWPDLEFFSGKRWRKLKFLSPGSVVMDKREDVLELRYVMTPPFTIRGPVTGRMYIFNDKRSIVIDEPDFTPMKQLRYRSGDGQYPMFR